MEKESFEKILSVFENLRNKLEREMLIAILALNIRYPSMEAPVLLFVGKQNTGKTALANICRRITERAITIAEVNDLYDVFRMRNSFPSSLFFFSFTQTIPKKKQKNILDWITDKEINEFISYLYGQYDNFFKKFWKFNL